MDELKEIYVASFCGDCEFEPDVVIVANAVDLNSSPCELHNANLLDASKRS